MIALLRLILVKGFRDSSLLPVLLGPVVLVASPIIGVGTVEALRGRGGLPFLFFKGAPGPQITVVTLIAAGAAILAAGVAAFLAFRAEIMNRSLGLLVLACRPVEIASAAVVAGTMIGIASLALSLVAIGVLMGGVTDRLAIVAAMTLVGSLVSSAAGILFASISTDSGMMIPLAGVAITTAGFVLDSPHGVPSAVALAAALLGVLTASVVLERRCAG